jgi:hypothetical protein
LVYEISFNDIANGQYSIGNGQPNDLIKIINNTFQTFKDANNDYILQNTIMTYSISSNYLNLRLKINIKKTITEQDYTIQFRGPPTTTGPSTTLTTSWNELLGLDFSYNLNNYLNGQYAIIKGNRTIQQDTITITDNYNSNILYLKALSTVDGIQGTDILFTITPSTYTRTNLFTTINALFSSNPVTKGTRMYYISDSSNNQYTKIRWNINKVYTTQNYDLVFYDIYSFVSCFVGNSSIRNATSNTTLGWILGFQSLQVYPLTPQNVYTDPVTNITYYLDITVGEGSIGNLYSYDTSTNIVNITGDKTVNVNLYNYFMILLDDYNLCRINDGLVTITQKDHSVSLPSYATRKKYICHPVTGDTLNTGISNSVGKDSFNSLTKNQIYSINQIINTQNTKKDTYTSGPYTDDIFGLVPIKTTGLPSGSVFIEYGGTLQNQERTYFGPVNIHRMAIRLVNDKGDVVDLNGSNWSLQFICEQLYQQTSKNSGNSGSNK